MVVTVGLIGALAACGGETGVVGMSADVGLSSPSGDALSSVLSHEVGEAGPQSHFTRHFAAFHEHFRLWPNTRDRQMNAARGQDCAKKDPLVHR
ncbi:hypothetical protein QTO30_04100 [Yoonia sp. GPGPB17]|uniref:hypothetical protein n=1 Tax=Yoonia sp. GPGPB17 TaxID=3026147 RepID=UPI0030C026FA